MKYNCPCCNNFMKIPQKYSLWTKYKCTKCKIGLTINSSFYNVRGSQSKTYYILFNYKEIKSFDIDNLNIKDLFYGESFEEATNKYKFRSFT